MKKILVVEDEADMCLLLEILLAGKGSVISIGQ
jgi:CheY-like chemotaxis protein